MFRFASLAAAAFYLLSAGPGTAQISGSIGGDLIEVLDRTQILLSGSPVTHELALLRAPDGALALAEATAGAPVRVAPLGLEMPGTTTWGNIAVHPGDANGADHTLVAIMFDEEIRLLDLGVLTRSGFLDPVLLGSIPVTGSWNPRTTTVGIIAILIGQLVDPQAPAVRFQTCSASGCADVVYGFDGKALRQVHLIEEEGIWF